MFKVVDIKTGKVYTIYETLISNKQNGLHRGLTYKDNKWELVYLDNYVPYDLIKEMTEDVDPEDYANSPMYINPNIRINPAEGLIIEDDFDLEDGGYHNFYDDGNIDDEPLR